MSLKLHFTLKCYIIKTETFRSTYFSNTYIGLMENNKIVEHKRQVFTDNDYYYYIQFLGFNRMDGN